MLLGVATSESMKPRPCFHHCNTVCAHVYYLFACCTFYYRFILPCFATLITHILPFLLRTSAPIQLLVVLGVCNSPEIHPNLNFRFLRCCAICLTCLRCLLRRNNNR